ncbi:pentapeptide repeat-containing protein [Halorutilales archaeon Cl-col2-1]
MSSTADTCSFVADQSDWQEWGGFAEDWPKILNKLNIGRDVWECPFEALDNRDRCIFHLPLDEIPSEKDKSDELFKVIQEDEYEYIGGQFIGCIFDDLIIKREEIGGNADFPLIFIGSEFKGDVRIEDCSINIEMFLNYSSFIYETSFDGSEFYEDVVFDGANFNKGAYFREVMFERRASFERTSFRGATFRESYFAEANFYRASFDRGAAFGKATFQNEADFREVNVNLRTNFPSSEFNCKAKFKEAEFDDKVNFLRSNFNESANFRNANFNSSSSFRGSEFCENDGGSINRSVCFTNTRFRGRADFTESLFDGRAEFRSSYLGYGKFCGCEFIGDADFSRVTMREGGQFGGDANIDKSKTVFRSDAMFSKSDIRDSDFSTTEDIAVTFQNSPNFSESDVANSDFSDTNFEGANFSSSDCSGCSFDNTKLGRSNFENAELNRTVLLGADMSGCRLSGALLGDARIDDKTKLLGHPSDDGNTSPHTFSAIRSPSTCVYDPDYEDNNQYEDIDKAKSVYRAFEELGGKHARPRLQARSFVRRQDLQKQDYWDDATANDASLEEQFIAGARWGRAKVARATLLYGESPWRVIAWSLGIIFSFALLYPLGGWMKPADSDPITYAQIVSNPIEILNSVYYSTLTYTALGFGDFQPVGLGRLLTTLETGFGAVMLALLVFILGRRAAR